MSESEPVSPAPIDPQTEVDYEILDDTPDDPAELRAAIDELVERAKQAGIEAEHKVDEDGDHYATLAMPAGRDTRKLYLRTLRQLREVLATRFDRYVVLPPYEAICSYEDGTIEALIRPLRGSTGKWLLRRLRGEQVSWTDNRMPEPILLQESEENGIGVSIGHRSADFEALSSRMSSLTVTLTNTGIARHEEAVALLEKISNALFFEIEIKFNIPIALQRIRPLVRPRSRLPSERPELAFPASEYDPQPMSLYWYARSAAGMPLLQYLALYQVLEFYFPIYAQQDVHQRLKNILRNPGFNPHSDSDVGRLVSLLRGAKGRTNDERTQLKATLQACIHEQELRDFVNNDEERSGFLTKDRGLNAHRLQWSNKESDLRSEVATRIYDIRCKIVHTKNEDAGEAELLLPFSKEAESLHFDIELIQFAAREVLIANSRPLRR
jgi:hypothetical protein